MLADYVPPSERGVVHFTTVPRDMRPPEVCLHFNQFGTIVRNKFTPYPKKERRPGGPLLPLQYKEGWVEFSRADDAKAAAAFMNNQPVNCKRTRRCYGQLWTVKYLDGFSWDTLVEEREGERRARRAAEVDARRQERDANEAYRRMVMQAQQARQKRRSAHKSSDKEGEGEEEGVKKIEKGDARAGKDGHAKKAKKAPAAVVKPPKKEKKKKAVVADKSR